jgi:flagellar hook-basal body complex protein FliE
MAIPVNLETTLPLARPTVERVAEPTTGMATSFTERLRRFASDVDGLQKTADSAATDFAEGRRDDIHGTMLDLQRADISFHLLANIRNRALEAYREIMRMGS